MFAVSCVLGADPAPAGKQEQQPTFLLTPPKAPALPLGDPIPRPTAPPSLLPDEIPTNTKQPMPPGAPTFTRPSATMKPQTTAADLELRVRYRKARNAAETNAQVRAAWEDSRAAKTDLVRREALKRYYDLLFAKMLGADRGIATLVEQRHKAEVAALSQTRIAPTVAGE